MQKFVRKICIFGTTHAYQRFGDQEFLDRIRKHAERLNTDALLEEGDLGHVKKLADSMKIRYADVDLNYEDTNLVPEARPIDPTNIYDNSLDLDFHAYREWVWVIRTSARVEVSGLIVCGYCHVFSLAEKFRLVGFETELRIYQRQNNT
jgi:hypothetical protein